MDTHWLEGLPKTTGAWAYERWASAILISHTLRATEVSEQEVELVLRGLVWKLVQAFLGRGGGLQQNSEGLGV